MEYKKVTNLAEIEYIVRTNDDGSTSWIPLDPANSDYQAYLAWLENPQGQQSTPMVTDEATTL
jgi:hypothetical protein